MSKATETDPDHCIIPDPEQPGQPTWKIRAGNGGGCLCGYVDFEIDRENQAFVTTGAYNSKIIQALSFSSDWFGNFGRQGAEIVGGGVIDYLLDNTGPVTVEGLQGVVESTLAPHAGDGKDFVSFDVQIERQGQTGLVQVTGNRADEKVIVTRQMNGKL